MKRILLGLGILVVFLFTTAAVMRESHVLYLLNGGAVKGGTFDVESGATFALSGTAVTSTASELNALDGLTSTVTELNYNDITTLGTAEASKTVTADANIDVTGLRNVTTIAAGTVTAGTGFDCLGAVDCDFGSADITDVTFTTDEGTVTVDGDVTLPSESTGGNAGAKHEFIGLPRVTAAALGTMVNGTTATFQLMDDSPTGECAPIGANTEADDTTNYRAGSHSYKLTFQATVGAAEGVDCDVSGAATTAYTSFGFWFRSDTTFNAGDMEIVLDDGASAEATENMPAYSTANVWQWIEVDVTGDCAATCSDIDGIFIQTTAQAPTTFNNAVINIDFGAVWKVGDEDALSQDILQDGVLYIWTIATAAGTANTQAILTEYTDYFINYQSGADAVVTLTDQSAKSGVAVIAY